MVLSQDFVVTILKKMVLFYIGRSLNLQSKSTLIWLNGLVRTVVFRVQWSIVSFLVLDHTSWS